MLKLNFNFRDISQIMIGAFALAVPISFSEEAWRLGETLPAKNLVFIFMLSTLFLAIYSYEGVFQGNIKHRGTVFVARIIIAYTLAGLIVALVLLALGKFPIVSDPITAIKRMVVITMPASMGAIVVDGFDKE